MGYINFYAYEKITDRVYVVTENYSMVHRFTIGVIVGDKKVLVIDSGMGMDGDLRKYIESFAGSDKPMICACSHGAIDHAGAAILFDEAYLNSRDYDMLPKAFILARRLSDLDAFSLHNKEVVEYCREHAIINKGTAFKDIDEGDVLDLGGVKVEPIRTPGHSKGHLAYFCRQEKVVFCGDAINADTHIKGLNIQGLRDYSEMLKRFISIVGEDVRLFAGHLNRAQSIQTAKNLAAACEEVADSQTEGDPPGESIFIDQKSPKSMRMHYHGNSCIVYNADQNFQSPKVDVWAGKE
jgi:hydroxyacylglutathione hydrolase